MSAPRRRAPLRRLLALSSVLVAMIVLAGAARTSRDERATAGHAGDTTRAPRRPRLEKGADTLDWRAYFACALTTEKPEVEQACLYWARHMEPERAEPWLLAYMISGGKDSISLRRARELDPFIYRTRIVTKDGKPGIFTPVARLGWVYLEAGDYHKASVAFARYLPDAPTDLEAWWGGTIAFRYRGNNDSAATLLGVLVDSLRRRRDAYDRLTSYVSLELVELALARAQLDAHRRAEARATLEQTLVENLAFYHARMMLGDMALQDGDTAGAWEQWRTAAEVGEADPVAQARYARYLVRVRRLADAEAVLRRVVSMEPLWVGARRELAVVLDSAGAARRSDAVAAYETYLRMAPSEPVEARETAVARVERLRGS